MINIALIAKKIARKGDELSAEKDGDAYWDYQLKLRKVKQEVVLRNFLDHLVVPDMTELSKERFENQKNRIAKIPEERISSHILFKCGVGECDRAELRPKVSAVFDTLEGGGDFSAAVQKYSQDPGTKAKDGKFDVWLKMDTPGVSPAYVRGVFGIDEIGGYKVLESQFGIHIVRLDDIKESAYLPYEQVKGEVIKSLEQEYRVLSVKDYNRSFQMSADVIIDDNALDSIFKQYATDAE